MIPTSPFVRVLALAAAILTAPALPQNALAQNTLAQQKLQFINSIQQPSEWFCRATPQGSSDTSPAVLRMRIQVDSASNAAASMRSSAEIGGKEYASYITWSGRARATSSGEVWITLDQARISQADPLPGDYEWSDPSGDRVELEIIPDITGSGQPFMLSGTQTSEFGLNRVTCMALKR